METGGEDRPVVLKVHDETQRFEDYDKACAFVVIKGLGYKKIEYIPDAGVWIFDCTQQDA